MRILIAFFLITFAIQGHPEDKVWVQKLNGIYLLGDPCLVKEKPVPIYGVVGMGIISCRKSGALRKELCKFIGCPLSECGLGEMRRLILDYYKRAGYKLIDVYMPPQEVTDGILQLVILETRLCQVEVCGNRWTSENRLKNYLRVCPGEPIQSDSILRSLSWMNRNPFRRVDAVFYPGEYCGTTNIQLWVDERRPFRGYYGWDDRGNEPIGIYRQFVGFSCGNPRLDGVLTAQATFSSHWKRLQAYTARYEAFLPWGDTLWFYGGISHVHSEHLGFSFRNTGYSWQATFRYEKSLCPRGYFQQWIGAGADYKSTNNNLEFSEHPVFSKTAALLQFAAEYRFHIEPTWASIDYRMSLFVSPNFDLPHQNAFDYKSLRPFAKPFYLYGKVSLESTIRMPQRWCFWGRAQGQLASRNLLPSEEFGLGGMDTVRGYEERIANGDRGALINVEFRTPSFSFFQNCAACIDGNCASCEDRFKNRCCNRIRDGLRFLAFADFGTVAVQKRVSGQKEGETLLGVGPGLLYIMEPYFSLQADWGFRLTSISHESFGGGRFHFVAVASF